MIRLLVRSCSVICFSTLLVGMKAPIAILEDDSALVFDSDSASTEEEYPQRPQIQYPCAYFNRDIVPILKELITHEQKGIYAAHYECGLKELVELWKEMAIKKKLAGAFLVSRNTDTTLIKRSLKDSGVALFQVNKARKHWGTYKDERATRRNFEDMHHKILIFEKNVDDKRLVVIGSFNLTTGARDKNYENIVILDNPTVIASLAEELNTMYEYATPLLNSSEDVFPLELGRKNPREKYSFPRAHFSPDIREVVKTLMSYEQEAIDAVYFRFTLYDVAKAWAKAKVGGTLIVDSEFNKDFTEALTYLRKNGIELSWFAKNYYKGSSYYVLLHHKFMLFKKNKDDKELLLVGSFNMTGQASENNWENVVIIDDETVIEQFKGELKGLYEYAKKIQPKQLVYTGRKKKTDFTKKMNGLI